MDTGKQVAKSLERQHIKHVKSFYRSIAEINLELGNLHREIQFQIDQEKYQYATDYVNQFISYTSVWNIKFVYNLENPEVALLQLFHLEYIFEHEPEHRFNKERQIVKEKVEIFNQLKPYEEEHIQLRKQKMLDFIQECQSSEKSS